ncbi:hypothetical protein LguiA_011007 [Lonicera macranthoides]
MEVLFVGFLILFQSFFFSFHSYQAYPFASMVEIEVLLPILVQPKFVAKLG